MCVLLPSLLNSDTLNSHVHQLSIDTHSCHVYEIILLVPRIQELQGIVVFCSFLSDLGLVTVVWDMQH